MEDHSKGVLFLAILMVDNQNLVPASKDENAEQKEEAVESDVAKAFGNHGYNKTKGLVKSQEEDDLL